jgi:hypothetical protein
MSNGMSGPVKILTAIGNPASARTLADTEGSVKNNVGGFWTVNGQGEPVWNDNGATTNNGGGGWTSWSTVSNSFYHTNIMNRHTGATVLRLPLTSQGAQPIDLIRRPPANEDANNPAVFGQRYFSQASVRILLSDRPEDITNLPTVTDDDPIELNGNWIPGQAPPMGYAGVPIARSIGPISNTTKAAAPAGTYAAPYSQIYVNPPIAAGFLAPPILTVEWGAGPTISTVTGCTGRTMTTFTGCNVSVDIPAAVGTTGLLKWTRPDGLVVSAQTNITALQSAPGLNNRTITLNVPMGGNPHPTLRFVPPVMWVNGNAVTCEGYTTLAAAPGPRFTNCRGLTAAPGTNQTISTHALSPRDKGLIGGFIKIEKQDDDGDWTDVTLEILNLGIGATNQQGTICADPTPNAVIRIQRLADNGNPAAGAGSLCTATTTNPHDWWPNALYDTREGNYRPGIATNSPMYLGGVMNYISLDVGNLKQWLAGNIGTTGDDAFENNGYIIYFSDRRGDHSDAAGNPETGEYGWENFVNPTVAGGVPTADCPAAAPQAGEDVNGNGVLDCWGETPHLLGVGEASWAASGYQAPFNETGRPWTTIAAAQFPQGRVNRQVLFRRALKLVNAAGTNLPTEGLTVVAENPVYVQGNYNASNDPVANPNEGHAPAAIIADAVAILSNNWTDANSFRNPNDSNLRPATTTGYRFAVVTGKSLSFPSIAGVNFLFGTDGGAGNFLRMMEDWGGVDLNYRGSMVSLFISRQGVGTFKWGAPDNVYFYSDRNFKFDDEFLQPALLPPGTPMFRDVNLLTFRQILRPNQ